MGPATIGLGLKLLGFFKKYWLQILLALILAAAVWHYMALRNSRDAWKHRAELAESNLKSQNAAIVALKKQYDSMSKNVTQIVDLSKAERQALEKRISKLGSTIERLKTTPAAPTFDEQCQEAEKELRNLDEVLFLLNSR